MIDWRGFDVPATTEITLRRKYRDRGNAKKTRADYGGNNRPAKPKRKLSDAERELHARQPKKIMRLAGGKRRMEVIS